MSSMLKKKGGLAFKPRAPQLRRGPTSSTPSQDPSTQATDRPSQTPAPVALSTPSSTDPPPNPQASRAKSTITSDDSAEPINSVANATVPETTPRRPIPREETSVDKSQSHSSGSKKSGDAAGSVHGASAQKRAAAEHSDDAQISNGAAEQTDTRSFVTKSITIEQRHQPETVNQEDAGNETTLANEVNRTKPSDVPPTGTQASKEQSRMDKLLETSASVRTPARRGVTRARASIIDIEVGQRHNNTSINAAEVELSQQSQAKPRKGPKSTSAPSGQRKRAANGKLSVDEAAETQAEATNQEELAPPTNRRRATKRKAAKSDRAAVSTQESSETAKAITRTRKRKRSATTGQAQDAEGPQGPQDTRDVQDSSIEANDESAKVKKQRRKRSVTPEDAETREVDTRELKMEDLTQDLRIGKKFSRHDELLNRLREKKRSERKKKAKPDGDDDDGDGQTNGDEDNDSGKPSDLSTASPSRVPPAPVRPIQIVGPQFEVVDGQIVVNQASLVHDMHAVAAAEAGELEEVEENDFTRHTNSNTYLKPGKLRGPNVWSEADTAKFYGALRQFGTEFSFIAAMFPHKSRRAIKLKFNREERVNPAAIDAILMGETTAPIDVAAYERSAGMALRQTAEIEAEHARRESEHEAEQKRIEDEAAAAQQRKRKELLGQLRNGEEEEAEAEAEDNDGAEEEEAEEPAEEPAEERPGRTTNPSRQTRSAKGTEEAARALRQPLSAEEDTMEEIDITEESAAAERAAREKANARGRGRGRGGRGRGRGRGGRDKGVGPVAGGFGN